VVVGPTVVFPQANEWVHSFKWQSASSLHGKNKSFNILKTMPDTYRVSVDDVRTQDNIEISIDILTFIQLTDVNVLLDATHDPLTEIKTAITATCGSTSVACRSNK
jgi:hypothetical protein